MDLVRGGRERADSEALGFPCYADALRIRGLDTAEKAWESFTAAQESFPNTYPVYNHYRKCSWVPRLVVEYGIDRVLAIQTPETRDPPCCPDLE